VAGDRFRLEVQERDQVGTPESRRLRKQGFIPGVLYGKTSAVAIAIKERDLRVALTGASGLHAVLDVVVEGKTATHSAILKEYQRDPIRGHLRHVDLQEVRLDQPIQATVTVHLIGTEDAPGVKEGGVLSAPSNVLNVEALPMEVPESIEVDVSGMEMGDTLRLEDVQKREGVTFLDDPHDTVLATVSAPMRAEELEAAEDEAAAEGLGADVEGEEAPEAAAEGEAAEGEAAPEGEASAEPGESAES
jgi:large subunit ribosomal protein L25